MSTGQWTGECNCCGMCCTVDIQPAGAAPVRAVCEHLEIIPGTALGAPQATRCRRYSTRYEGMPIRLHAPDGHLFVSVCNPGYPGAESVVPKECSYQWQGDGPRPERPALIQIG